MRRCLRSSVSECCATIKSRVRVASELIVYRWVSTTDRTCARQARELQAFAKKAGYKIACVY